MVYLIGSFLSIQLFLLSSVKCFAVFLLLLLFFSLMTILFGFLSPYLLSQFYDALSLHSLKCSFKKAELHKNRFSPLFFIRLLFGAKLWCVFFPFFLFKTERESYIDELPILMITGGSDWGFRPSWRPAGGSPLRYSFAGVWLSP